MIRNGIRRTPDNVGTRIDMYQIQEHTKGKE